MPQAQLEIEALWAAMFGEPPPISAPVELLIDVLVSCAPMPPPYSRFVHLKSPAQAADGEGRPTAERKRPPRRRSRAKRSKP